MFKVSKKQNNDASVEAYACICSCLLASCNCTCTCSCSCGGSNGVYATNSASPSDSAYSSASSIVTESISANSQVATR